MFSIRLPIVFRGILTFSRLRINLSTSNNDDSNTCYGCSSSAYSFKNIFGGLCMFISARFTIPMLIAFW